MIPKRILYYTLIPLLCIGYLNLTAQNNSSLQNLDERRGELKTRNIDVTPQYEGTESQSPAQFFQRGEKKPMNPLTKAYRDARANGDIQKMRELEAQFPSQVKEGAANEEAIFRESTTKGYPGEPGVGNSAVNNNTELAGAWGMDIHVRGTNTDFRESYPAMATASDGTIYVVWENYGSTDAHAYLQIYYSTDGGDNWIGYGWFDNSLYDLKEPSLAIGEGGANDLLLIAYIVDDPALPYPEVVTSPLTGFAATIHSIGFYSLWENYSKPNIWTDSYDWDSWFAYLTCAGTYDIASNWSPVVFWRSTDQGTTFTSPDVILGNYATDHKDLRDPDGTYGTTANNVYVACYDETEQTIYTLISQDYGATWSDTIAVHTLTTVPVNPVDPDIEAAVNYDNIMLCCTKSYNASDNIAQCYSTDAGVAWSGFYSLEGFTSTNEFAAELTANEGGNSWHVTYTSADWWVYYSTRPQDLSAYWQLTPDVVNDIDWASVVYTKKAITSNWATDAPGIAWSDYRDGSPDYDIYFDKSLGTSTFPLTVSVTDGWNMVSVPGLHPTNQNVTTWWSGLTGSVFKYSAGYTPVTTTAPTEGYWMKNSGAQVYNYPAIEIVTHNDINAAADWNMIGGYENTVPVGNLYTTPPGLIAGTIYEYSGGYNPATDIVPGYGYWVKMSAAGLIGGLGAPPLSKSSIEAVEYFKENWGKITITDNAGRSYTLYAVNGKVNLDNYELPPMPPVGMFDVRYGSGRIAEDINSSIQSIEMSGIEYPVRVTVENMSISLQDETGSNINAQLNPGEVITISNNLINKLLVLSGEIVAPIEYALEQNYPNPFNPSTRIKFTVPKESLVNLSIYNVLGELVSTLVNEEKPIGIYEIEFDATELPSGIYFYRLQSGSFVETKKMILLK